MMQLVKMTDSKTSRISDMAKKIISLGVCVAMTGTLAGCTIGEKKAPSVTIAADAPYFAMKELEFYETAEGEQANVISMTPCEEQVVILLQVSDYGDVQPLTESDTVIESEGAVRYVLILYDMTGEKTAEIDLGDILEPTDSVISLTLNNDGNFVIFVRSYDEVNYTQSNKLYTIDGTGKVVGTPVIITFSDESFYPDQMVMDASGNLYFGGYGMESAMVTVMDSQGKTLYEIKDKNLNGSLYLIDGVVYADGYNTEGNDYMAFLLPIEANNDNHLGEKIDVTKLFMSSTPSVGSSGLYVNSASGIYSYDLATQEKKEVLLWNYTDIDKGVFFYESPVVLSNDIIFLQGSSNTATTYETKISILVRQDENPNVGKKIIRVSGIGIAWDTMMQTRVYTFNKESKDYRIEIVDYAEDLDYSGMSTHEEYLEAYSEMNQKIYTEMISGTGPDVIYFTQGMSFSLYESKGLLVDLNTLMEGDTSFNKEDYLQSILTLCETDGHLYKMPICFFIKGFAGAKLVIGDRTGWTVDEFNAMVNTLPSSVMPLANYTQNSLLTASLNTSMDDFVDVTTGKVNFDSEEFCQLLDMTKMYGTVETGEDPNYENNVDEWTFAQNGDLALMTCMIINPSNYDKMATLFGEDVSIVGYPSSTKAGPLCCANAAFAISSESESIDGAWSFVKTFFNEEAQNNIIDSFNYGIPIMTSVFEKQIDRAMHPEDYNIGGTHAMSEASAQAYRDLINKLDTLLDSDQQILSIIMEEVPAYFNGQKTDQSVAALIQNRVQMLVNERQ